MGIRKSLWGHHEEKEVYSITLTNGWLELSLTNFGCTIVSVLVRDKNGAKKNLVLGYDSLQDYIQDPYYIGCIVGRFANRIANARFQIGEQTYILTANEPGTGNHLHGGEKGFGKKVFHFINTSEDNTVQFYYRSADGEEGYPGNLNVFVTYRLTNKNEVIIDYNATTDKTTPVNLTNHSYFNLSGLKAPAINQELFINAAYVLEADARYIPTGTLNAVAGTDLDFTEYRPINQLLDQAAFRGYNECFLLAHTTEEIKAALRDPQSGRRLTVQTSFPGIMLYTGDFLKTPYLKNQGICLETQFFPDSPNQPAFPQTLLHPGEVYQHQTIYQFFD